ncbi:hypothetical protein DL771_000576 [Monosporascus sp. 5C6A]|nr:hypothetical protein DL771_000576 [Monosporascus sp. 5C6A]
MSGADCPAGFSAAFGPFAYQVHRSMQNSSTDAVYSYDPLRVTSDNVTEIRLLEIEPGYYNSPVGAYPAPSPGLGFYGPAPPVAPVPIPGQISVRLTHFRFDDTLPPFTALSYNWGDQRNKRLIRCNDVTIGVGPSLHAALMALRDRQARMPVVPGVFGQPRCCFFWIDALCIDQENDEEKGQQVPLMNDLYRRAAHVLVWLGDPEADGVLALPFMRLCASAADVVRRAHMSAHQLTEQQWVQLGFPMAQQERWRCTRALLAFLGRPWFRRVWVIQEYAVGRSVTFLCGRDEFPQVVLSSALEFLTMSQAASVPISEDCEGSASGLEKLNLARTGWWGGRRRPLLTLLRDHQAFHATVWKDKIYALMRMASDVGDSPTSLNILISYEKEKVMRNGVEVKEDVVPVELVYRSVAIEMMQKQRSLAVLSGAGTRDMWTCERLRPWEPPAYHTRLPGLPSWVPDWHLPDSTTDLLSVETSMATIVGVSVDVLRNLVSSGYRASAGTSYVFQPAADANQLAVRGISLGSICVTGLADFQPLTPAPLPTTPDPADSDAAWAAQPSVDGMISQMERDSALFASWLDITAAQTPQLYFTGEPMLEVLWQTMMAGLFPNGIHAERALFLQWYKARQTPMSLMHGLREQPWLRTLAVSAYSIYKTTTGGFEHQSNFRFRTKYLTTNRVVFRTAATPPSFGYVGLAPRGSRQGDVVMIMEGSDVPFVLRQRGPFWELVGACYVHGVMSGQMFHPARCVDMVLV